MCINVLFDIDYGFWNVAQPPTGGADVLLDLLSLGTADAPPISAPSPSVPLFEGTQNSLLESLSPAKAVQSVNGSTTGQGTTDFFGDLVTPAVSDRKGKF